MQRIRAFLASLTPAERKSLKRAAELAGTVIASILVRRLLAGAAVAGVSVASTLAFSGGTGDGFAPMAHANLSAEVPAGTPIAADPELRAAAIAASDRAADRTTTGPDNVLTTVPLAAPAQRGCKTDLVRNHSSRNGARPALLVAHFTVSANRDGWGDVDAIVDYFDNARAQASSTYVIDFEGNCAYIVPETAKPWTQGYFNPWSISIEFIATGQERVWDERALRKGARVFADAAARWGIPIRRAKTSGCQIVSAGVTDHDALGCGNNHTDVKPYFPMAKFIRYVRAAASASKPKYRVCAWKPKMRRARCQPAVRPLLAVERAWRQGYTRISVSRA